jgi:hypothetical protein
MESRQAQKTSFSLFSRSFVPEVFPKIFSDKRALMLETVDAGLSNSVPISDVVNEQRVR